MPPIAGVRTYLTRPAPCFDSLRPFRAHQNMRVIDFKDCTIARPIMCDLFLFAANRYGKWLALHARNGVHAGTFNRLGTCSVS
jgi:hypothetical protein